MRYAQPIAGLIEDTQPRRARRLPWAPSASKLERKFTLCWLAANGPPLEREYRFDPDRKWRFDFAHVASKHAIELEGGIWGNGAHSRGVGYTKDCEKYNAATLAGWRVLRFTGDMITTKSIGQLAALLLTLEIHQ